MIFCPFSSDFNISKRIVRHTRSNLSPDPLHEDIDHIFLFRRVKSFSGRNMVPFLKTCPAAASGRMLGQKHRMTFHRRLFAVMIRCFRRKPLCHKVLRMSPDRIPAFISNIFPVFCRQPEPASKCGPSKVLPKIRFLRKTIRDLFRQTRTRIITVTGFPRLFHLIPAFDMVGFPIFQE